MEHTLKILPVYFEAQDSGRKNFEIRKNDRDFQSGDTILLVEFDPERQGQHQITGRQLRVMITYVTDYAQVDNYVVLGTKPIGKQ